MVSRTGADRFEMRLERLFAEAPAFDDADAFVTRVQGQMNRGHGWRTALVGIAGVGGAAIAVMQSLNNNLTAAVQGAESAVQAPLSGPVQEAASQAAAQPAVTRLWDSIASVLPVGGLGMEVWWIAGAMAAAGLAMLAVRTFGEA